MTHPMLHAFANNTRAFSALKTRFIIARYGRNDLGFVWMFVEPALLCIGVMGLWSLMGGHDSHGINLISMVFTGYMPLTLWRHVSNSGGHIYRSAKGILIHKNITYIDVFFTKIILEFLSVTLTTIAIYVSLYIFDAVPPIYDFGIIMHGWFLMAAMAFSFASILAPASEHFNFVEKFVPAIQYVILPLSGCFFLLDWMPSTTRELLSYFPLVHAFELFRSGFFGPVIDTYASPAYAWIWAILGIAGGFWYFEAIRDRIE